MTLSRSEGATLDTSGWIPLRWPCGPAEVARARDRQGSSAREIEALGAWCEPRSLELVAGSPVNCLVVTWAEGGAAADAEQQRALAPLVAAARPRGLAVVGWAGAKADLRQAAEAARAAGLDALATDSVEPLAGFEVLRFRDRGLGDRAAAGLLGVAGGAWPGLRDETPRGADAESGPTGPPWLDSNAWLVRLARALVGPRVLWLALDPPELGQPVSADAYVRAIADSEAFGARPLLALDPHLRADLADRRPSALAAWDGVAGALAFFASHREWAGFEAVGQIGVVSDFAGPNELMACEALNLLGRRGSLYRILPKQGALEAGFGGLDSVLYVDEAPPEARLGRALEAFAEAGGTLVTPPFWPSRGVLDDEGAWPLRFRVFRHGRGRLAVAREAFADPFLLAEDTQLLTSHRHDRLRVFNPGTAQLHYLASADGRTGVLHAVLHDRPDPREPMTVWFRKPWSGARAWSIGSESPLAVGRTPAEPGVDLHPSVTPVYFALELSA